MGGDAARSSRTKAVAPRDSQSRSALLRDFEDRIEEADIEALAATPDNWLVAHRLTPQARLIPRATAAETVHTRQEYSPAVITFTLCFVFAYYYVYDDQFFLINNCQTCTCMPRVTQGRLMRVLLIRICIIRRMCVR